MRFFLSGMLVFVCSSLFGQHWPYDQEDFGLSKEVSVMTTYRYNFSWVANREGVSKSLDTLSWKADEKTQFNAAGFLVERQYLEDEYVEKYFFGANNQFLETHVFDYTGRCFYKDIHSTNNLGRVYYTKRVLCESPNQIEAHFIIDYKDTVPMRIYSLEKDSATVYDDETRVYDEKTGILWMTTWQQGERTTRSAVLLKKGQIIFYTTFLRDSSAYTTWDYIYNEKDQLVELRYYWELNGERSDTARFVYEYDQLGCKKTAYQNNDSGKVVVTSITQMDKDEKVIYEESEDEENPGVMIRTAHEFIYDKYGNWIYEITYVNDVASEVRWRKLEYFE